MYAVKIMDVRRSGDEPQHCKSLKKWSAVRQMLFVSGML